MMTDDRVPLVASQISQMKVADRTRSLYSVRLPKMEALTGARGFFAIYVVIYHFFGVSLCL